MFSFFCGANDGVYICLFLLLSARLALMCRKCHSRLGAETHFLKCVVLCNGRCNERSDAWCSRQLFSLEVCDDNNDLHLDFAASLLK